MTVIVAVISRNAVPLGGVRRLSDALERSEKREIKWSGSSDSVKKDCVRWRFGVYMHTVRCIIGAGRANRALF